MSYSTSYVAFCLIGFMKLVRKESTKNTAIVHYKLEEKTTHDLWEAIPYEAAETPAIFSRFSSPYWLITLTFVMFQKEVYEIVLSNF